MPLDLLHGSCTKRTFCFIIHVGRDRFLESRVTGAASGRHGEIDRWANGRFLSANSSTKGQSRLVHERAAPTLREPCISITERFVWVLSVTFRGQLPRVVSSTRAYRVPCRTLCANRVASRQGTRTVYRDVKSVQRTHDACTAQPLVTNRVPTYFVSRRPRRAPPPQKCEFWKPTLHQIQVCWEHLDLHQMHVSGKSCI